MRAALQIFQLPACAIDPGGVDDKAKPARYVCHLSGSRLALCFLRGVLLGFFPSLALFVYEEVVQHGNEPDFMRRERGFGDLAPRSYVLPADRLREPCSPVELASRVKRNEPFPNVTEPARIVVYRLQRSVAVLRGKPPRGDFIRAGNRAANARAGEL